MSWSHPKLGSPTLNGRLHTFLKMAVLGLWFGFILLYSGVVTALFKQFSS
jgi:hypothetical protein